MDKIFLKVNNITPYKLTQKLFPKAISTSFTERWVFGHLCLSLVLLFISINTDIPAIDIIFLIYAVIRISEIFTYLVNVLFFDPLRAEKRGERYKPIGRERMLILLFINMIELMIWFAIFYGNFDCLYSDKKELLNSFFGSLYFSTVTMTTLGYGDITPQRDLSMAISIIHTFLGVFIISVVINFLLFRSNPDQTDE